MWQLPAAGNSNMQITTATHQQTIAAAVPDQLQGNKVTAPDVITGLWRWLLMIRVRSCLLLLALRWYKSPVTAFKVLRAVQQHKHNIQGSDRLRRCIKVNGRYYFGLYIPSYPSKAFDEFIYTEFNRVIPIKNKKRTVQILQLAVTSACPLHCEHCFEWNNLRKKDPFSPAELQQLIHSFTKAGCAVVQFTGGEPLVKKELLQQLLRNATGSCEYWALTSGWGLNSQTARELKEAGLRGVVISIDHYDAATHNRFRGNDQAFESAINAAFAAKEAGLVTAFSVCVTRYMANPADLLRYARLAKDCGASFVQLLEPKAVGHYENQPVQLLPAELELLDQFYLQMNFDPLYKSYPVFIYHGYYQRRIGCQSAGKRVLYIDSAGYIDACPFCQTRILHARSILNGELRAEDISISECPSYRIPKEETNKSSAEINQESLASAEAD